MFYIIESEHQIEKLKQIIKQDCFIEVIPSNPFYHPKLSTPLGIYIRPVEEQQGYILPIDHPDCLNLDQTTVQEIVKGFNKVYTLDSKKLLYYFNIPGVIDLNLLHSMVKFEKLDINISVNIINNTNNRFGDRKDLNKLVPITKLYEYYEYVYVNIKNTLDMEIPKGFDFYNNLGTKVFFLLEQSGLRIDYKQFNELYKPKNPLFNIKDNIVYTSFNLYNSTSRPTNSFNSVNFAALPKEEQYRKCFYPKNSRFLECDFDGYHIRLLADLFNYKLTKDSAHEQLAKTFLNKESITQEEYQQAKQMNFQAIYGKIPRELKKLEFFKKIQELIDSLWKDFKEKGVIYNPMSEKPYTTELKGMNPSKLMNYFVQGLETSRNISILKEVLKYLRSKKSEIVLFTYDSIIVDFDDSDGRQTVDELVSILEQDGKYPVKLKSSKNLVL